MAITKVMAVDDQPFSVVEDEGLSEVLEVAEPRYDKPCRERDKLAYSYSC